MVTSYDPNHRYSSQQNHIYSPKLENHVMKLPIVVSARELSENLSPALKIADVRPLDDFNLGHIPNAVSVLPAQLNRSEDGVNGLLPDQNSVNLLAESLGLSKNDHLVAYDQGASTGAARLVWVLHAYGFNNVSWLNGGLAAWERAGGAVSTEVVKPAAGDIQLEFTPGNMLSVSELTEQLGDDNLRIIDVRSEGEFNGTDVRSARGGHMPNAKHCEWTTAFKDDGELKSDDVLRELFGVLDVKTNNHVSVYCQTHQRSAVTYLVLKHLQFENVTALDGAWSNWGNQQDTPIES